MWRVVLFFGFFSFGAETTVAQRKESFRSYFRISDIPYIENKPLKENMLDVYMPKKGSRSPVIIWVHGGNWTSGDKKDIETRPEYFAIKGYIIVSVNYRLSPRADYQAQAQDVAQAVAWVYRNIIHYSGDKEKIFLMGSGTGAHLAALVSVNDKFLTTASGTRSMIRGMVSVEGIGFDIPATFSDQSGKFQESCVSAIGNSIKQLLEASPVSHVKADGTTPPFMFAYSGNKSLAEIDAKSMAGKLSSANIKAKLVSYPNKSSHSMNRDLGREGDRVTDDILVFLYECLR